MSAPDPNAVVSSSTASLAKYRPTLADVPDGTHTCGYCRCLKGQTCDIDARLGRGCTRCRVDDRQCNFLFDNFKTLRGKKRSIAMEPRPDGLIKILCCDQCAEKDIKTCSWRRLKYTMKSIEMFGSCQSCAREGMDCTHAGMPPKRAYEAGHTHFDLTQRLISQGKTITETNRAPRSGWDSPIFVANSNKRRHDAPDLSTTDDHRLPRNPKPDINARAPSETTCSSESTLLDTAPDPDAMQVDVSKAKANKIDATKSNLTATNQGFVVQDVPINLSGLSGLDRRQITPEGVEFLHPGNPPISSVRDRMPIMAMNNCRPRTPLFYKRPPPVNVPVVYPHPNPTAISALCTIPIALPRNFNHTLPLLRPCSERKPAATLQSQQPVWARCNNPTKDICFDTAHDLGDVPTCNSCHSESVDRYFSVRPVSMRGATHPDDLSSVAEDFARHVRVYACFECTRYLINTRVGTTNNTTGGGSNNTRPLPDAICDRRVWTSKHLVPQAPAAGAVAYELTQPRVVELEPLTGCSCGVKLFAPFSSSFSPPQFQHQHQQNYSSSSAPNLTSAAAAAAAPVSPAVPFTTPRICVPHRLRRITEADAAASRMRRWLQQEHGSDAICPLCVRNIGIDTWFGVTGLEELAGENLDFIAWGCLVCHEVCIARRHEASLRQRGLVVGEEMEFLWMSCSWPPGPEEFENEN